MTKSVAWIEHFRPEKLDDIVGQERTTKKLSVYVKTGQFGNLMFSGSPGTGKTTSAIAFAKEIYGDYFGDNFIELNASDERGIDVVRNKIQNIASSLPVGGFDFKIIFLDECDSLTSDAQSALRRTMEKYTSNCRFILSCNYSSKVIEPIQSRCAVFRFGRLDDDAIRKVTKKIVDDKNIKIDESGYLAIIHVAQGDSRKAINALQNASIFGDIVNEEIVYDNSNYADPVMIEEMINLAMKGKFIESRNKLDDLLLGQGFSGDDVLYQMWEVLDNMAIPNSELFKMKDWIGEIDYRLTEGANDRIQLDALLAKFVVIGGKFK